ncbi:type II toxin-antitoxin system death-on-curing family toxin [Candidatus Saccharibacteria bacterium]|nr:type II toxin-antitoxin system death-on-curing family toxin [Candidatus Saccharibacteria bacterium]
MKPLDLEIALLALQGMPIMLGLGKEPMWQINGGSVKELATLLERPFQQYGGQDLYPTPAEKVAVLFYQTIKDHRFENGNKRTAVILVLALLIENGYWLKLGPDEIYDLALRTAESKDSEAMTGELTRLFGKKMTGSLLLQWMRSLFSFSRGS